MTRPCLCLAVLLFIFSNATLAGGDSARGEKIFQLANCYSCHTDVDNDGPALAGGRELSTPFGVFVTPNITADDKTGIGRWSEQQFIDALTKGLSPSGDYYFPAFPYTAYQHMTLQDIRDLRAYLYRLPAVTKRTAAHRLKWFVKRPLVGLWQWLNARLNPPVQPQSRGQYIVQALGHCGECHTPRNRLGILDASRKLQGNEALEAPDLTAHNRSGIVQWSDNELIEFMRDGLYPDGDYVGGEMTEVVENSMTHWSPQDMQAVIGYLRSLK